MPPINEYFFKSRVSKIYLHTYVHSSITHNGQKVETTPGSINEWTDKKCGPSIEWNSFQPQKGRKFWHIYNMDKSMLSKMSQSQKDKPSMFLLVWFKETESWMIWKVEWQFPSAGSGRNRELVSNGDRISFLQDERVVLISCMTMWIHLTLLNQIAPLGPPVPTQPPLLGCGVAPLGCHPWPQTWGSSSGAGALLEQPWRDTSCPR